MKKNTKTTINIALVGPSFSGKTTTLLLLFRSILEYFKVGISGQDYQDILNLLYFKTNRILGHLPATLEVIHSPEKISYFWQFYDASYSSNNGGYLDTKEHIYLPDTHILFYCLNSNDSTSESDRVLDEIIAMKEWIGSNHPQKDITLVVMLGLSQWEEFPTLENSDMIIRKKIAISHPNILSKFFYFNEVKFWYNPFPLEYLMTNPIPEPYHTQAISFMGWLSEKCNILPFQTGVNYANYHRLYRIENHKEWIFSHPNRWSNTQGNNFLIHLPSGKKIPVYYLENEHRYWASELPSMGKFTIYDIKKNQYIQAERLPFSPRYLKLENSTYIDTEKKISGKVVICQDRYILITQNPFEYWDINQRIALKAAGIKNRFAIYPSGHVIDMQLGNLGFYDEMTNIVKFPGQRFYYLPLSFYWSIRQLWAARMLAIFLAIISFFLLGYVFPILGLKSNLHFHNKQAIFALLKHPDNLSSSAVESLISLMDCSEYHSDIELLLSQIDAPIPKSLSQRTKDKNQNIRQLALKIVGKIRINESIPFFLNLLNDDESESIRKISCDALCFIDPWQSPFYIALFHSKSLEPKERQYGAFLLGRTSHPNSITFLKENFLYDKDERVRQTAIRGLIPKKSKELTRDYLILLQDSKIEVASMAMQALCKIFPKQSILFQQILQLRSDNLQEQFKALRYLTKYPSKYTIPYLIALLGTCEHSQLSEECRQLLVKLNPKDAEFYNNIALLKSKDIHECRTAIKNLVKMSATKALPYIKVLLYSPKLEIQTAAQEAIYNIESQQEAIKLLNGISEKEHDDFSLIKEELLLELENKEKEQKK